MTTFLVTGGSGFLGAEVCRQLEKMGGKVLDLSINCLHSKTHESYDIDITRFDQLEQVFKSHQVDVIVHLASLLTTQSNLHPELAFRVNVLGSQNLLEITRQFGIQRFVYASSFSSIGYHPYEGYAVDETVVQTPDNFYGETKRFVEKIGQSYADKFGFQFVAGRLGSLVGPGQSTPTSAWRMDIFNLLKSGGKIEIKFAPQTALVLSHLTDTARAFVTLASADKVSHSIYHLPHDLIKAEELGKIVQSLRSDIKVTFGTATGQDMPSVISTEQFMREFNFQATPLAEALKQFQAS